jgi:hypothetical protein
LKTSSPQKKEEFLGKFRRYNYVSVSSLTTEIIKNGGPELLQRIFELLIQIWDQERMPEEWGI